VTGIVHLGLRLLVNWPFLVPPFTQPSPLQIPRTPTEQRLTKTTLGIFRTLLSRTVTLSSPYPIVLAISSILSALRIHRFLLSPRLVQNLESNNLINPSQYGFGKKHSTLHPLVNFLYTIVSAWALSCGLFCFWYTSTIYLIVLFYVAYYLLISWICLMNCMYLLTMNLEKL
jgi:hypothetical protein